MMNVAVIGVGNMGVNHTRVYSELDNTNLVAISDVNEDKRKIADKYDCKFYINYMEMLEKEDISAISVAVPTKLHDRIVVDCLDEKKHVLVEKPIADDIKNAEEIIATARKNNSVLMVGHIERFNPAVQKLKEIMNQGNLGEITSIVARRVGIFPSQIKDANVVLDLAVHDVDVFNYLLNKRPTKIYAKAGRALGSDREDHAMITLDYGETNCFIQAKWITPVKIRDLAVTGTKGYAELNYITQNLRIYESIYQKTYDSFGDFVVKFGIPNETKIGVEIKEPLRAELEHFIGCIKEKESPITSGEDGLLALKISLAGIESYENEKVIGVNY